ncbi:GntR family transcriptional regulator [Kitasatospora sp. MAP12-15]|uniref:GntR family transcriptional regulator n=1 Tax=unclassified Kitasatospora TaxID=2633591 RepID=UPI002474898F|nr:GntR family transcriptional regulator [Kitasatospora sp. MAP12-44]MDH6111543.1 GntR family transcriptional regulator [Kitasatospora sp. MAP12-44]
MAVRYTHVADDLRRRIGSGVVPAGDKLPSEGELAATYRVGLPTLRRALEVLQGEGLIEKVHGRGNFVRLPSQPISYVRGRSTQREEQASTVPLSITVSVAEVPADGDLPSLLQVVVGTALVEWVYLGVQAGLRRSLARVYVPKALAITPPEVPRSPWGEDARAQLLAAGVQFAETTERTTARFPTADEAEALRIAARAPVLSIVRTAVDADGRVVECTFLVLPGDRSDAIFITAETDRTGCADDDHC